MRSFRFRLLIAAMAVFLGTALAKAQAEGAAPPPMHGHGHWGYGGDMREFFAEDLNLTDAQQAQMKEVLHKEHGAMKPLMQQLHQARQQLHQYEEGTFDEAKVRALATQQAQTMIELAVQHSRTRNELFQVLTPDQQAKLKEAEARHEVRMDKHMHSDAPAPPEQ